MKPSIAMRFAKYVVWILLCKHCKFYEKIYNNSRKYRISLGGYFMAHPIYEVRSYEITTRNVPAIKYTY